MGIGGQDTDTEYSATSPVIFMEDELSVLQKHGTFRFHIHLNLCLFILCSSARMQVIRHACLHLQVLVSPVELDTAADHVVRGQLEQLRFIQILTPLLVLVVGVVGGDPNCFSQADFGQMGQSEWSGHFNSSPDLVVYVTHADWKLRNWWSS